MIGRAIALFFAFAASGALAEEPSGCSSFSWNVDREIALLRGSAVEAGDAALDPARPVGVSLTLKPFAEAELSRPPRREPQGGAGFAGAVYFTKADYGRYVVALSATAWIDVIQKGQYADAVRHSCASGCETLRKVVEFELLPEPFIVQLSGADSPAIKMVVVPSD